MRVGDMQEIELESSSMDSRRIVSSVSLDIEEVPQKGLLV